MKKFKGGNVINCDGTNEYVFTLTCHVSKKCHFKVEHWLDLDCFSVNDIYQRDPP